MKRLILILIPFVCYGQTFKGLQRTQGNTYTVKANELFESFPNSLSSNPVQNAVPDGWVAWFDPNQNITLNGSTVSQWCDLSNTYCLTQGTAANQPTYVSGTRPYLSFNGTTNNMSGGDILGLGTNSAYSIFAVVKANATTAGVVYLGYRIGSNAAGTYGMNFYDVGNNTGFSVITTIAPVTQITGNTVLNLLGLEINRGQSSQYSFANGGYRVNTGTITNNSTNYSGGTFAIGSRADNSFYANCNMYDIIIYNRQLSRSEYNSLYSFFKAKYALP